MRIIFIGTAGTTPTKFRGLPSLAIERNGELFLFDCGEGTQRQMMQFSINMSRIKAVFLTHTHGDHTLGLAGLVRTLTLNRRTAPLDVFIPHGGEKLINGLINFDRAAISYKINVKPVKPGIVYRGRDFSISAFRALHTASTYGFAFKEDDKIKFKKPKAKELGIRGTAFAELLKKKQIKIGKRTIRLNDVTFKETGKKIVYVTDTRPTNETVRAAMNVDILIHEATYAEKEKELAKERMHSTASESATLAKKAKAKRLFLIHPSARYRDTEMLLKEAKRIFKKTEMAKDGMTIDI